MRHSLRALALACVLAVGLTACVTVPNPVGRQSLATVEATYGAALSAAVAYKRLCIAKQTVIVGSNCRDVVAKLQGYDRAAHAQILIARDFVKNHPNIDASSVISAARASVAAFQDAANATGVN